MDKAAGNGHLHVVEWLHDNREEGCTVHAMNRAAFYGHLLMVKWLHENRTEGSTGYILKIWATRNCQSRVVKWLHENRK